MSSPKQRERKPARLKPMKLWAVVDFDGRMIALGGKNGVLPLLYSRRSIAREIAPRYDARVVPVEIRSLQHRPR